MTGAPWFSASLALACGLILVGCATAPPTPTPTPTRGPQSVRPRTSAPPTEVPPSPFVPPAQPTVPPATAPPTPVLADPAAAPPALGCTLPRGFERWELRPATGERPAGPLTVVGEVSGHDPEARNYALVSDSGEGYALSYSGAPLGLTEGDAVRVTAWQDPPGGPPAGYALGVEGRFYGWSARETDGALVTLINAVPPPVVFRQLPSPCLNSVLTACGYELRAAPVAFGTDGQAGTFTPGQAGPLSDSPWRVSVHGSHVRRWVADAPCPDPTDYILSLRMELETPP